MDVITQFGHHSTIMDPSTIDVAEDGDDNKKVITITSSPNKKKSNRNKYNSLSTHVLNTMLGLPAVNLAVLLALNVKVKDSDGKLKSMWKKRSLAMTNHDGRVEWNNIEPGIYRLTFYSGKYFHALPDPVDSFFPSVEVIFIYDRDEDLNPQQQNHNHVPLLLSPYSYSTYKGS